MGDESKHTFGKPVSKPVDPQASRKIDESQVGRKVVMGEYLVEGGYKSIDITTEAYRIYTWTNPHDKVTQHSVRIDNPTTVVFRPDGTTHRVVAREGNQEIGYIVPAPGHMGCSIKFAAKSGQPLIVG